MTQLTALAPEPDDHHGFLRGTFRSAWKALMLQEEAYGLLVESEHPFRRGLGIMTLILLTAALAVSLGMVFDYLSMPRAFLIQERVYQAITGGLIYGAWIKDNPFLVIGFDWLYRLIWFLVRTGQSYPSRFDAIYSFFSTVVFGIFDWITYVFIAQIVARRLGSTAKRGTFYATMALAYAPRLLLVANIVPGLSLTTSALRFWILATSYQAVRATFKLSWKRSIAVVVLPYFITALLLIVSLVLGVALGVGVYQLMY